MIDYSYYLNKIALARLHDLQLRCGLPLTKEEDYKPYGNGNEVRYNPYHDPKTGRFASGKSLDNSGKYDIIKSRGEEVSISSIEQPIEQQHTGKGNPNAILVFDIPLNNRQQKLLESLPDYDSRVTVPKDSVNMADLSALTAKTGNEFAVFTKDNERLIIRGNATKVNINVENAAELARSGYKWSGHTHPGTDLFCLQPSNGDIAILNCFNQPVSVIYNSKGQFQTFNKRG